MTADSSEAGVAERPVAPPLHQATAATGASSVKHDRVVLGALLVFAAFMSQIALAQSAYALALVTWLVTPKTVRRPACWPRAARPLLALVALTAASCLFSLSPLESFTRMREVALYGILVVVATHADTERKRHAIFHALLGAALVLAVWGIVEYQSGSGGTDQRIRGPIGHWMTFSGLLVLSACVSLAYAGFHPSRKRRVPYIVLSLLISVTLLLSLTRGAYLALLASLSVLLAIKRPRLLLAIPALVGVAFLLAPHQVQDRVVSMLVGLDDTAIDRLYLWRSGVAMIGDHPVFGVGLSMVQIAYTEQYRDPHAPKTRNNHLHNNVMQVAAERGLPALLAWLWFFVVFARQQLGAVLAAPSRASPVMVAGLLAIVAFHTFGLVEYNFGDSEILMMLLLIMGLAEAERREAHGRPMGHT